MTYDAARDTYHATTGAFDELSPAAAKRLKDNLITGIISDSRQYAARAPDLAINPDGKQESLNRLQFVKGATYAKLVEEQNRIKPDELQGWDLKDLSALRREISEPIRKAIKEATKARDDAEAASDKLRDEFAAKPPEGAAAAETFTKLADGLLQRLDEATAKENEARRLSGEGPAKEDPFTATRAALTEIKRLSAELREKGHDQTGVEKTRAELSTTLATADERLKNFGCHCGKEGGATGAARCVLSVPGQKALAWTQNETSDCSGFCAAARRDRDCSRLAQGWGLQPSEEAHAAYASASKAVQDFEKGLGETKSLAAKIDEQRKIVATVKREVAALTTPLAQAATTSAPATTNASGVTPSAENVQFSRVASSANSVTIDLNVPGADAVSFAGQNFALTGGRGRFTFQTGCCGNSFPEMWVASQGQWRFSRVLALHGGQNIQMTFPQRFVASQPRRRRSQWR